MSNLDLRSATTGNTSITSVYALTRRLIFSVWKEELGEDEEVLSIVLERQLSFLWHLRAFANSIQYLRKEPLDWDIPGVTVRI